MHGGRGLPVTMGLHPQEGPASREGSPAPSQPGGQELSLKSHPSWVAKVQKDVSRRQEAGSSAALPSNQ